jgi:nitric oxide reductase subunit B
MSEASQAQPYSPDDLVSNVLKWILLAVAIVCFALIAWATVVTYDLAPPQPDRFVSPDGTTVLTGSDIVAGKGGFQKADLMDYGSLYGMGSYFGRDYTAYALKRLANLTEDNLAQAQLGKLRCALARTAIWHPRSNAPAAPGRGS